MKYYCKLYKKECMDTFCSAHKNPKTCNYMVDRSPQPVAGEASNPTELLGALTEYVKRLRKSEEYCGGMDHDAPTSFWRAKEEIYEECADELEEIIKRT